jgi:hypothetical protein
VLLPSQHRISKQSKSPNKLFALNLDLRFLRFNPHRTSAMRSSVLPCTLQSVHAKVAAQGKPFRLISFCCHGIFRWHCILTVMGAKRIVPCGIPTKWKYPVVSDSRIIPADCPKWTVVSAEIRWPGYALLRMTSSPV